MTHDLKASAAPWSPEHPLVHGELATLAHTLGGLIHYAHTDDAQKRATMLSKVPTVCETLRPIAARCSNLTDACRAALTALAGAGPAYAAAEAKSLDHCAALKLAVEEAHEGVLLLVREGRALNESLPR